MEKGVPRSLVPLLSPLGGVAGVGEKTRLALKKLLLPPSVERSFLRPLDVLFHKPSGVIDRRATPKICELFSPGIFTLTVQIAHYHKVKAPKKHPFQRESWRVECFDGTGTLSLLYFNAPFDYLKKLLPLGEKRIVSGKVDFFSGAPQMVHPEYVLTSEAFSELPLLEPVYPLASGVSPKIFRRVVEKALQALEICLKTLECEDLRSFFEALYALHAPKTPAPFAENSKEMTLLATCELLAHQASLAFLRRSFKKEEALKIAPQGFLIEKALAFLPFALTQDQQNALQEIKLDLASGEKMCRLLQGDVGSGKTVIAFLTLLLAVEEGLQGALMAPTDLLARQHFSSLSPLAQHLGVGFDLLTAREKGKTRVHVLGRLQSGESQIVVGTHALFQDEVDFFRLGCVVIDEQHRFGVAQRLRLQEKVKEKAAHVLAMSATPIPRTLSLTLYGDMDFSTIRQKPQGRQPIVTRVVSIDRLSEVISGLHRTFAGGNRAYWVCPLIEENEELDLVAAQERYQALALEFPGRVGLVHGKMVGQEKDRVMEAFSKGELSLLIATTVVEVGVHVPEATVMVVEHAERFGLSQVHQLRGRVGRGVNPSACILLYHPPLGELARRRLEVLRACEDGFLIAEEDLKLRGAGDILGTKQSGLPSFRFADLNQHAALLQQARKEARVLCQPTGEKNQKIFFLLCLFEHQKTSNLFKAA